MAKSRGKFIVFYGINNLGKSTQANLLVEKYLSIGQQAKYLKYPVYNQEPSGVLLNKYLREGNPYKFSPREAQIIYAFNRLQYEPILMNDLNAGINIIAEDYWGTGVAWGMGAGVDKTFLLKLNNQFFREDLALLFVGNRFVTGIENHHLHETDFQLTNRVHRAHNELAKEFGWKIINANETKESVFEQVMNFAVPVLGSYKT